MNKRKVLVISQPCVLGYFNAGHHISLYEVSAHLRKSGCEVTAIDASATLGFTWKDVPQILLKNKFDIVAVFNDFDVVEVFSRFVEYVREFSPQSKIVTFGRLSSLLPDYYKQFDVDAVVSSGDYEPGVSGFLDYINGSNRPSGVTVRENGQWIDPDDKGLMPPASDWVLPDVKEVPYESYNALYSNDLRRFCGIPERMELVVPVARGCTVKCNFCEIWPREGLKERRISVERTIAYIKESFDQLPFEYVSFYAPTFTLNKSWVRKLCSAMKDHNVLHPWKCTTTQFHLDRDLVRAMADAKCFRISVGIETFETGALSVLPKYKHEARIQFDKIYGWCQEFGIELNCFVVVGLPGTTVNGTKATFEYLSKEGIRIRPSIYSNYGLLRPDMTEHEMVHFLGRHILPEDPGFSPDERMRLYQLAFVTEKTTSATINIPVRR